MPINQIFRNVSNKKLDMELLNNLAIGSDGNFSFADYQNYTCNLKHIEDKLSTAESIGLSHYS